MEEENEDRAPEVEKTEDKAPDVEKIEERASVVEKTENRALEVEKTEERASVVEKTEDRAPEVEKTEDRAPEVEQAEDRAPDVEKINEELPESTEEDEELRDFSLKTEYKTSERSEEDVYDDVYDFFPGEESFRMYPFNFEESLEGEEKETEGKESEGKETEEEFQVVEERKEEEEEQMEPEEVKEEAEGEMYPGQYPLFLGEGMWGLGAEAEEEEEEEEIFSAQAPSIERRESTVSEALSNVYSKLSPYCIDWSFGVNATVELINLTSPDIFEVFCVTSHFGVIYNYRKNTMSFLPGHNYPIQSIATDARGRWLVSADAGEDTAIIIWDNKKRLPVWCLYNVFPGEGVKCVKISQDGRYLAASNCDFNYSVKFWVWTRGPVEADGIIRVDPACGKVKHIDFNHKCTEQFAITAESKVIFCEWSRQGKLDSFWSSYDPPKKRVGVFVETLFLDDNHTALTATTHGHVIVWCDVKYSEPISESTPGTIKKTYLKTVKIHKTGITSLRLSDKVIGSSSEDGTVFFHDQFLRLVYWLPKLKLDPLVSISFNLHRIPIESDPFSPNFDEDKKSFTDEEIENVTEYDSPTTDVGAEEEAPEESEKSYQYESGPTEHEPVYVPRDPSDCTIEMRPINIRDFIFLTRTGRIGYVSHKRRKVKYYLYKVESTILCMDCHPSKNHLASGDNRGKLTLYDYVQKKILNSASFKESLTAIKYSTWGHILIVGFENGCLFEVDPFLFTVRFVIEVAAFPILKICFSYRDESIAFYDQRSTVYVCAFQKKQEKNSWVLLGKYNSHYKPIKGIMFGEVQDGAAKLYTIGEDRMLVEYDVKDAAEKKLVISSIGRIEQTAIPCCFDFLPQPGGQPLLLISNNEYKLKVIDPQTRVCQKTTLGPTADSPIDYMKVFTFNADKEIKMIYGTDKHVGIRILPPTGNPFEGLGIVAHPEKLVSVAASRNASHLFTTGIKDSPLLVWRVNLSSVEVSAQLGGIGLEPFISLIEGGPSGFLFHEIEDFFYYAQIIHQGEDPNVDRSVSKNLALCEVPDLFRSLGYYPTDYEVDNILYELKHLDFQKTKQLTTEVTFEECVKAYLNHKPVHGMSLNQINKALLAIADLTDPTDVIVERDELYKALEKNAEGMDHAEVIGYLCILLLPKDETNPIPLRLPLSKFAENVLGIDFSITEENVRQITHAFENKNEPPT